MIDLLAFDDRGAVRARIDLADDRLVDLLARGNPIHAVRAERIDIGSRHQVAEPDGPIDPGRLLVVVATGPRGVRGLRLETRFRPVSVSIGAFLVHGFLHAPAPVDPLRHVLGRAWVPVTDAVLEYRLGGRICRERFDALLLNRAATGSLSAISEASHEVQWLASGASSIFPEAPVGV